MNLKKFLLALVSVLSVSFAFAQHHGGGSHFGGNGGRLEREISRLSSDLLMYSRQMAYPGNYLEREAIDNLSRFNMVAQRIAQTPGPANFQQQDRFRRSFDRMRSSNRNLRAFSYYRNEFRRLGQMSRDLIARFGSHPIPPRPFPIPHPGPGTGLKQLISCGSFLDMYTECRVEGRIQRVLLRRKHSNSACRLGVDYGYSFNTLWVDNGCRATFDVFTSRF